MRLLAVGIALAFLAGSSITVTIKRQQLFDAVDRAAALHTVRQRGYDVAALDLEPRLKCPGAARGYTFTAVRDGHLLVGGGCVRAFHPDQTIVVTLPPLR
jgi:hypothetical protein